MCRWQLEDEYGSAIDLLKDLDGVAIDVKSKRAWVPNR
jgi:hypothetical protein